MYTNIHIHRNPDVYFLYMNFDPVFTGIHSTLNTELAHIEILGQNKRHLVVMQIFYTGVYLLYNILKPYIHLSPSVYMSPRPAFIQINIVHTIHIYYIILTAAASQNPDGDTSDEVHLTRYHNDY